ncbi:MAG: hypothetical protein IJU72_00465 [Bacteroidales bacterium]|nr:hypothetical protein [Bacteroidales bacterium]
MPSTTGRERHLLRLVDGGALWRQVARWTFLKTRDGFVLGSVIGRYAGLFAVLLPHPLWP